MNREAEKMFEAIRENKQEEARVFFESSLKRSFEEGEVEELANFADALHQAGFLDESREAYVLLKEMAPSFEEWDLFLAEIAIDQNRMEEGLDILLQFDESSDFYPNALLMLADAYQMMGLYEVSEHKIREAMQILPEEPIIQYALGKLYQTSGDDHQAVAVYETLLRQFPEYEWAENLQIVLAECYIAMGRFEDGIASLEQVAEEEHTSDSLFQLGFSYLQIKEYNRSASVLEQLLNKDPDYFSGYYYLAQALEEEQQLEEALHVIKQGIQLDPYQADFRLAAAKLYLKLHEKEKAEKQVDEAIELDPDLTEAVLLKAEILLNQEKYEEIIAFLENNAIEPSAEHDWLLAQAYNGLEEYESAAEHYLLAYDFLSDNPVFLEDYSQFLQEEGNQSRLSEVMEMALILDPENEYFNRLKENRLYEDL